MQAFQSRRPTRPSSETGYEPVETEGVQIGEGVVGTRISKRAEASLAAEFERNLQGTTQEEAFVEGLRERINEKIWDLAESAGCSVQDLYALVCTGFVMSGSAVAVAGMLGALVYGAYDYGDSLYQGEEVQLGITQSTGPEGEEIKIKKSLVGGAHIKEKETNQISQTMNGWLKTPSAITTITRIDYDRDGTWDESRTSCWGDDCTVIEGSVKSGFFEKPIKKLIGHLRD